VLAAEKRDEEACDLAIVVASSGMRKGEVPALRWCELDLDKSEVHVAAGVSDGGPGVGLVRKSTKTSDWRDVPLTETALIALKRQLERRRTLTGEPGAAELVFPAGIDGSALMRPDTLGAIWAAARGSSMVTLQHLRHFVATRTLDAGESTSGRVWRTGQGWPLATSSTWREAQTRREPRRMDRGPAACSWARCLDRAW
jgi:integrase